MEKPSFAAPPVVDVRAWAWDVPMRAPYRSAQRITTVAHNVLVRVELAGGAVGWGESAPARYVTGETQEAVQAAIANAAPALIGQEPVTTAWSLRDTTELAPAPGARGALEMALLDAGARANRLPLFQLLGGGADTPTTRETDLSLPLLTPGEARTRARDAHRQGFATLKVKVGGPDKDEDAARVRAVADGAPNARLRLDGNQGFTGDEAIRFIDGLGELHSRIELFEQPTPAADLDALHRVSRAIPFPVFADESVKDAATARRLIESGACGGVVLKVAKSGLVETGEIARTVHAAGGQCLFGCMMETRIAIGAALHLTLALGHDTVGLLDLDGHLLVRDGDLLSGGLTQTEDRLTVDPNAHGLGVTIRTISGDPTVL